MSSFADYTDVPYYLDGNGEFTGENNFKFSTKTGYYQEWDHYVIFWSTGYGKQSGTPQAIGNGEYLLNLSEMRTYAEKCYTEYVKLGFLDPLSSDGGNHKIIILAYYSTDWFATGSGYGDYGTLNISHASANPSADYYTYCHEIAHAYQYLGNMKNGGNAGFQYGDYYGYVSYYECSGNWQAAQVYKDKYFPQLSPVYIKTTNLAFGHQWHCYQAYPMNDYFCEKRNIASIGDIWTVNTNTKYADPLEKYMYLYNLNAEELYREVFFFAMRATTWDLNRWSEYLSAEGVQASNYIDHTPGTKAGRSATSTPNTYNDNCWQHVSTYQYVTTDASNAIHQVAYSSVPQSTGYNVIKLNVPNGSNRTVTTTFTALPTGSNLANGDKKEYWCGSMWATNSSISKYNTSKTSECNSDYNTYKNWRGFRLGYVTYNRSTGERNYNYTDKVYCTGTEESSVNIQFDVPNNVDELYLIVSPALSNYLRMGSQDPYNIDSDNAYLNAQKERDQWPYRVQFYNTNIYGLTNPTNSFNGTAESGKTYNTSNLPDMNDNVSVPDVKSVEIKKDVIIDNTDGTLETQITLGLEDLQTILNTFNISLLDYSQSTEFIDYDGTTQVNKIAFKAESTEETSLMGSNCTNSTYSFGHWFDTDGKFVEDSETAPRLFSQLNPKQFTFNIGMKNVKNGQYTIRQSLIYNDGEKDNFAYITFQIKVKGTVKHLGQEPKEQYSTNFNPDETEYTGSQVSLSNETMKKISQWFGLTIDEIKSAENWEEWSENGPSEGKLTLFGVNADETLYDGGSTANGYGFWFDGSDNVCSYGNGSTLFAEYNVSDASFDIGQMPNVLKNGDIHSVTVAIVFTESGTQYRAFLTFNVTITNKSSFVEIKSEQPIIRNVYDLNGKKLNNIKKGVNILEMSNGDNKKVLIRE